MVEGAAGQIGKGAQQGLVVVVERRGTGSGFLIGNEQQAADHARRIAEAGKIPGCITVDSEAAKRFIDLGARYIASHAIKCMTNASTAFLEEIRS